ncbi:MAG: LysR family transcriptional regulator [Rhodospirillaceae bacterium]|jgi:DNA-binding transcriptional LysR family regulator|nr:LysR family transcriptional regulator [Rhodospirillaceae bacterium]MBT4721664.1 LysR family transcriptional regulator [Rhodospirillaceae bacterium]MBT5837725.1 LysR family transcriptional regulator [Rhodospirillaceae bacterium]
MDKLNAIASFVQIVEGGSLTAAAEAMNKSLPSVVRTLAMLEDSLQVRLLNRTTRRISLTDEGQTYLQHCRKILADVEDAEQSLSASQVEPAGSLTITAPVLFGQMHVAPLIAEFLEHHPQVEVDILLLDRVANLVEEGIDVGFRIARLEDSSMYATQVGAMRRVVCAAPELLQKTGVPEHPNALSEFPCVRISGPVFGDDWNFYGNGKKFTVPVSGRLRCNQIAAAVDACARGIGFGLYFGYQAAPLIAEGKLQVVLADFEPPQTPVSLIYPHAKLIATRTRVFLDWMAPRLRAALDQIKL